MNKPSAQSNEPLARLQGIFDAAPPSRDAMLAAAIDSNPHNKERSMNSLTRIFSGRSLILRLSIALLLLITAGSFILLAPTRGLSATDGRMLTYDLQGLGEPREILDRLRAAKSAFAASLPPGVELHMLALIDPLEPEQKSLAPTFSEQAFAAFSLSSTDPGLAEQLEAALQRACPGLSEASTDITTWFSPDGKPVEGTRISLFLDNNWRQFVFSNDASEEQINSTINKWLKDYNPDAKLSVHITVTGSGDQRCVNGELANDDPQLITGIMVESSGGEWKSYD